MWRVYHEAAEQDDSIHTVAYSTFCYLWRVLVPSVVVMKPRSHLCWQCQQNSTAITRTANSSDLEKSSVLGDALDHLWIVKMERSHYKSVCEECKDSIKAHLLTTMASFLHHLRTHSHQRTPLTSTCIIPLIMHKCTILLIRYNLVRFTS